MRIEQAFAEPAPRPSVDVEDPAPRPSVEVDEVKTASIEPAGWVIQVASSPSKAEADAKLTATSQRASSILSSVSGYTVPFQKDGVTYHRVRYAGFSSKTAAWKTCDRLKKKNITCYAVQN